MATQLFLVPLIVASPGGNLKPRRVPKYINGTAAAWRLSDFGLKNLCLIAIDPPPPILNMLNLAADVFAFPADIAPALSLVQLTALTALAEAMGIPVSDLTVANTLSDAVFRLSQTAAFFQRQHFIANTAIAPNALGLDTLYSALSASDQQAILATSASLMISTTAVTGNAKLRDIVVTLANQIPNDGTVLGISVGASAVQVQAQMSVKLG